MMRVSWVHTSETNRPASQLHALRVSWTSNGRLRGMLEWIKTVAAKPKLNKLRRGAWS